MRKSGLCAALLGLIAAPALAGPFAETGDRQLRQDVYLLAAAGLIQGAVESWRISDNSEKLAILTAGADVARRSPC